jgi:hypothetical protein
MPKRYAFPVLRNMVSGMAIDDASVAVLVNTKKGEGRVFCYGNYVSGVKLDCVNHKVEIRPSYFYVFFLFFSTFATSKGFSCTLTSQIGRLNIVT